MKLMEIDKSKIIDFLKEKQSKRIFVVTPINILSNLGFPVSEHTFIIENKSTLLKLKKILKELENEKILTRRASKQDFKGIKETGYDYQF